MRTQVSDAQKLADDSHVAFLGPDTPVAPEDRPPGPFRGAGARSPLFWKLMLVAMACVWGYSYCIMKGALETVPTFTLLACRFLMSSVVLLVLFFKRVRAHLNKRNIVIGVFMGVFLGLAYAFQTLGLNETTVGKSAFLTGTYCILVPFVSYAIAREPITRFNVGAALLCLAGIAFVALDSLSVQRGDVLTLVGAAFFALQIAMAAKYGRTLDVNVITFWMFLTVGVMNAAAAVVAEPPITAIAWTPGLVGEIAFLILCCTCLGLLVQNLALAHLPASTGSLLLSVESPSGVLFSVVLAGEQLTVRLVVGFALIFASIVLSETRFAFLPNLAGRWCKRDTLI